MFFIVICIVALILFIMLISNNNSNSKVVLTHPQNYSSQPTTNIEKQLCKAQKEVIKIAEEIKRSSIVIDNAFFVETIIHEWGRIEAKVAQLEKFENMTGIKISMSADQVLHEGKRQYNEGVLKAIHRQFDGFKLVIPLLKKQSEIIDYTKDMYDRIEYANKSIIASENQESIKEELDNIHSIVDDFCSPFISLSEKECAQNAKKLNGYCVGLNNLSIKLFEEHKDAEALKALEESGCQGNYWANRKLWDYYKQRSKYYNLELVPLYRLCAVGSVKSYRQAQEAITKCSRYKAKIRLAMAYGVGVEDWTDMPKGNRMGWAEDKRDKNPIILYFPNDGAYNFCMNRYVELLSNTKQESLYYYNLETIKVRRRTASV